MELTVDKIEELIEWLELPYDAQHPTQQPEGVFSSPLEIYKFLLTELSRVEQNTVERSTPDPLAEKVIEAAIYIKDNHTSPRRCCECILCKAVTAYQNANNNE